MVRRKKCPAITLGPMPEIIGLIPRPYNIADLGSIISEALLGIWAEQTTDADRDRVLNRQLPSVSSKALEILDAIILKQAETMGWRLGLSDVVHWRFCEWEVHPDGPALCRRYGNALARSVRRIQGLERPPLDDPHLYIAKKATVDELRQLFGDLRKKLSGKRRHLSADQLTDQLQRSISDAGEAFARLQANVRSWIEFFRSNSELLNSVLYGKRSSPAAVFDAWIAWSKHYDQETARQKISELGQFVRPLGQPKL